MTSHQHQKRKPIWILTIFLSLVFAVAARRSCGQTYVEYPKNAGKVQPLQQEYMPRWLTFDMDLRARTENQTALNLTPGNGQAYELTRVRVGLQVRPTSWLTAYIQGQDTHALGLVLPYVAANMRDTFDARQAYLNFHLKSVTIIAGRQQLQYGGERLVGISNWTNNSRTWDGFLGRIGDKNRLDAFSTSVVTVHPTSLDKHGAGLNFHGLAGTITTWVPHTTIVPFVFVRSIRQVTSQQGVVGVETEATPGIEVDGDLPAGWDYHVLGAIQRGSYSNDSIHSGAGFAKVGYTAKHFAWKPRLRGEYDYATGNAHLDTQRIGTFDQLYPSNHNAFGLTDIFGFQNIREARLNLYLNPVKNLTVLVQQEWLSLASRQDNIYSGSASALAKPPLAGFAHRGLGKEVDASGAYVFRKYFVIDAGVGHFVPDGAMVESGHAPPQTIVYFSLNYRFTLDRKSEQP
jgi:hypothetical protein